MAVKSVGRAVRGLAKVPIADMNRELARRQNVASQPEVKRAKLLSNVADLAREIRECGGSPNGSARGRGPVGLGIPRGGRSTTLAGALAALLKDQMMYVTELTGAVRKAGYKSDSPNVRTMVNATLIKHTNLFRRVGRGRYTAK